jgi:threonine/homoserine/homoserine lactone efflux protein
MFDLQILAFALAAAVLTTIPGQDTMLVVRNVFRGGRADGVWTSLGICSGHFVHASFFALGVSIVLTRSSAAYATLKMAGAIYLVWLGAQSLRRAFRSEAPADLPEVPAAMAAPPSRRRARNTARSLREGFLSNVLNPKTAIFYFAFLPQFIGADDPVLAKSLLLAAIHFVEGVLWLGTLAFLLDRMKGFFVRPAVRRWLDGLSGAIFFGLGARLALARR